MPSMPAEEQLYLRMQILDAVEQLVARQGGFLTWQEVTSFRLDGFARPLAGQRGIFNPNYFDHTLSITSKDKGPYRDAIGPDGLLHYDFEAGDPTAGANRKLRRALQDQVPIILFRSPLENIYIPLIPAYVVAEDLEKGFVKVAAGEEFRAVHLSEPGLIDKRYVEQLVKRRVHQPEFRARVISAYSGACSICRLKHRELLDAAHIIPDSLPHSTAEVSNGLSLCKIHHAAYDRNFLGIDPDYRVHINQDLLLERDGPMLKHGLQDMHGTTLTVPRKKSHHPKPEALEERFTKFLEPSNSS
jgi:putative restriction endonuclease